MNSNRRKFLKKASVLAAALLVSKHVCAGSEELPHYCSLQGGLSINGITLLTTSGNSELDRSLNLELSHVADSLNVLPGFGFYDDSDGKNAFATRETVLPNTRGTVVFGKRLLSDELTKHAWGGLAVAGVMAHEFAHIYQYETEFYELLSQWQDTNKLVELHADYLAGYYLGLKRLRSGEIDIKAFLDTLYLGGDTDFNSTTHHGTPFERKEVMLAGYKTGLTNNTNVYHVAQMGMNFVKSMSSNKVES